jgi:hypothetical protein
MSEHWIPGFLNADNPILEKDGAHFATREAAADAAERSAKKGAQLVVARTTVNRIEILEAARDENGNWEFVSFPNLHRVMGLP